MKRSSPKALILGSAGIARPIAEGLRRLGFDPLIVEENHVTVIPSLREPNAPARLREVLEKLVQSLPPRGGSLPHCIHPGASPWGERPEFPILAQGLGLLPLSPASQTLTFFSNKLHLLSEAERLGIPNLVLSFDPLQNVREIEKFMTSRRIHFPLFLRSAISVGHFGRFLARSLEDLDQKAPLWIEQLRLKTREILLFPESFIEGGRTVLVPFVRSVSGATEIFPLVDVSLQSRYRKLVELCPASSLDDAVARRLRDWAQKIAESSRLVGCAYLEFLVEGPRAFLLDGSPRLNSGFPLWEKMAEIDVLERQLAAAQGRTPPPPSTSPRSAQPHASGVILHFFSEDPIYQLPRPGVLDEIPEKTRWKLPTSDAKLYLQYQHPVRVTAEESGNLGSLLVTGKNRAEILKNATHILDEHLWFAGSLQTNERYIRGLLNHPWVHEGIFHSSFTEEEYAPSFRPPPEIVQGMASVCASLCQSSSGPPSIRWAVGDQWVNPEPSALKWKKPPRPGSPKKGLHALSGELILKEGSVHRVCATPVHPLPDAKWQVRLGPWSLTVRRIPLGQTASPGATKIPKVRALVVGRVHALLFRSGSTVGAHEPFLLAESQGFLIPHASPKPFKILRWRVEAEDFVQIGQELAEISVTETG